MDIQNTCLTCGSDAFRDVAGILVYCHKCKKYAQHVYCLEMSLSEYERRRCIWYCEDCRDVTLAAAASPTHDLDDCESMETEEMLQNTPSLAEKSSTTDGTDDKLKAEKTKSMKKKSKKDKVILETIFEGDEEAEDDGVGCDDQEGHVLEDEGIDYCLKDMDFLMEKKHVEAQPVDVPTWKGSLNISDKVDINNVRNETISGLTAHLSSLACAKVLEESKFLKTQLRPDLVKRSDAWPKIYDLFGTSDDCIALYFFPESERGEKDYDNLVVRMMQEDLAMRVDVEKAELLVFTSNMLPNKYQRLKTKIYLWGVFKEK